MFSFTLGCDPELICKRDGVFVPADEYFKSRSSFGLDGNTSVAEVRPGYSENPLELTAKIQKIIEYGHDKAPALEFYAGHYQSNFPIGGHIHFGLDPESRFVNALDIVLGSLSECIDDEDQRYQRERTGYGKKGAYRANDHGFEYRTCGSWLLSPSVTLVTLTLAKLSILSVAEHNTDFIKVKGLQKPCEFLKGLKDNLPVIPKDCLEGLSQLDTLLKIDLDWDTDILPNWGIWRAVA